jgi:SAM-dependent methyltransferase
MRPPAAGATMAGMTTVAEPPAVDERKLEQLVLRAVGEAGAALSAALVVLGDRLGLYRGLAGAGPLAPAELAARTGTAERYVREWLNAQAAGGWVEYDPETGRYTLPPEQTEALTDEESPAYLPGLFRIAVAAVAGSPRIAQAARTGEGIHRGETPDGWGHLHLPAYGADLVGSWLPALDGVVAGLERGGRVADVGCGHGAATILLAQAFPRSTFVGCDPDPRAIEAARRRAEHAGVADRVSFLAGSDPGGGAGFDLVTMLDCLHDLGDPAGAARRIRAALAPGGTWLLVEPAAGDRVEDNLDPVGRAYYALSTLLCTPNALAEGGAALGAQAGEARLREVVEGAGFRLRRVAETRFSLVFEARPG